MGNRSLRLDRHFSWFATFIASWVLLIPSLRDASSEPDGQMAYTVAVSLVFLLVVLIAWICRKVSHKEYPIIGIKSVLIVLGGSYIVSLISFLFSPEDYWIYTFVLQLLLIVSLWVRDTRSASQEN